jgi:hypothetical protein
MVSIFRNLYAEAKKSLISEKEHFYLERQLLETQIKTTDYCFGGNSVQV